MDPLLAIKSSSILILFDNAERLWEYQPNRVCTGHGNPVKSWISNLVKSRPGNSGK